MVTLQFTIYAFIELMDLGVELVKGAFVDHYVIGECNDGANADVEFSLIAFCKELVVIGIIASSSIEDSL
jgi:hypothetical protein